MHITVSLTALGALGFPLGRSEHPLGPGKAPGPLHREPRFQSGEGLAANPGRFSQAVTPGEEPLGATGC